MCESVINNNNSFISQRNIHVVDNNVYMMAGCQVGRNPSMLAAYNCILNIADNTNKDKKKKEKR